MRIDEQKIRRPGLNILLLGFSCLNLSGCLALALGAAGTAVGVTYIQGNLSDRIEAPVDRVHAATIAALESESLSVYEDEVLSSSARVMSEYADEKKIKVEIQAIGSASCKITIRVGATGNEQRSINLLEAIKARL